jgi:predicted NBD/HSP70 family sugar kinase
LARSGHPNAVELVRESGQLHGEVLATAVSLLNPRILTIGGDLLRG